MIFNIKYFFKKLNFLYVYFSPFRFFFPSFYIGKTAIGTPYFYPRKWIKSKDKNEYLTPIKKNIGFDFVPLGYKTKWSDLDYRHEYNPVWSFVFYGFQIALIFQPPKEEHYWSCWLVYKNHTNKKDSTTDRIKEAKEKFPCIWERYLDGKKEKVCYWDVVLKNKYVN